MAKTRVVMNQAGFGAEVMSSAAMEAALMPFAESVAADVPGAVIVPIRTGTQGGGSRVRLRIEVENAFENQARQRLISAIRQIVGG